MCICITLIPTPDTEAIFRHLQARTYTQSQFKNEEFKRSFLNVTEVETSLENDHCNIKLTMYKMTKNVPYTLLFLLF